MNLGWRDYAVKNPICNKYSKTVVCEVEGEMQFVQLHVAEKLEREIQRLNEKLSEIRKHCEEEYDFEIEE